MHGDAKLQLVADLDCDRFTVAVQVGALSEDYLLDKSMSSRYSLFMVEINITVSYAYRQKRQGGFPCGYPVSEKPGACALGLVSGLISSQPFGGLL
jgi:hypothetical protein